VTEHVLGFGIDFGTSNSLISIGWADRVEVVNVGSRRVPENLPSVIYLAADGNRAAGDDALEQYLVSAGVNSRLLIGIKSDLSDPRFMGTSSWGLSWTTPELVAVVLRRLRSSVESGAHSPSRVVLGHPVAFAGTEGADFETLQGLAMQRLTDAAQIAGFETVDTLEEPAAAALDQDLTDGALVSLDFGGGTFDVAIVDYGLSEPEVIGLQGAAIGGERFDELLFNAKLATELGLLDTYVDESGRPQRLPARISAKATRLINLRTLLFDPLLPDILRRFRRYRGGEKLGRLESLLYGGLAYAFYEAVEDAKIRLSTQSHTSIDFHHAAFDLAIPVTRAEFEALIDPDVQILERTIRRALDESGISAKSVEKVVQTGGSSTIPLYCDMVRSTFPDADLDQRPPFTTVVQGLGLWAQEVWR